jgi:hypothetical protein
MNLGGFFDEWVISLVAVGFPLLAFLLHELTHAVVAYWVGAREYKIERVGVIIQVSIELPDSTPVGQVWLVKLAPTLLGLALGSIMVAAGSVRWLMQPALGVPWGGIVLILSWGLYTAPSPIDLGRRSERESD